MRSREIGNAVRDINDVTIEHCRRHRAAGSPRPARSPQNAQLAAQGNGDSGQSISARSASAIGKTSTAADIGALGVQRADCHGGNSVARGRQILPQSARRSARSS